MMQNFSIFQLSQTPYFTNFDNRSESLLCYNRQEKIFSNHFSFNPEFVKINFTNLLTFFNAQKR